MKNTPNKFQTIIDKYKLKNCWYANFPYSAKRWVNFFGADVVEIGGTLPRRYVRREHLQASRWICVNPAFHANERGWHGDAFDADFSEDMFVDATVDVCDRDYAVVTALFEDIDIQCVARAGGRHYLCDGDA